MTAMPGPPTPSPTLPRCVTQYSGSAADRTGDHNLGFFCIFSLFQSLFQFFVLTLERTCLWVSPSAHLLAPLKARCLLPQFANLAPILSEQLHGRATVSVHPGSRPGGGIHYSPLIILRKSMVYIVVTRPIHVAHPEIF